METTRRGLLGAAAVGAALPVAAPALAAPQARTSRPTLIQGADLLTMDPKSGEVRGGDVLLVGGKIAAIGKGLSAANAELVDARGMILMPGMCDGHRHTWLSIEPGVHVKFDPRGYSDYQRWKLRTMAALTPEEHYLGNYFGALLAIDAGVTTLLDYPHGQTTVDQALAAARGARDAGIAGWHGFQLGICLDFKAGDTVSFEQANERYMSVAEPRHWAMAEAVREKVFSDTAAPMQFALAPSNTKNVPMEVLASELQRIRAMGVPMIPIHIVPPTHTVRQMHAAGLLGPDLHFTHANLLDDEELKMVADTGGMICATAMGEIPYNSYGWGASPVHARARAAGVAVGIGVDVPEALTQDYFEHVRSGFWSLYLTPFGQKLSFDVRSADVLDFATGLGARSVRLGDVTGTIAVGKRADLVLLRTDRPSFPDAGSLADRVVAFAGQQDIDSVWIMGKARKRRGRMVDVDLARLKAQLAQARARFRPIAETVKFV